MRRSKSKIRRQQSITDAFSKAKRCPEEIGDVIEDSGCHGVDTEGESATDELHLATLACDTSICHASSATRTFGDVGESFDMDSCSWSVHPSSGLSSEAKLHLLDNHFVPGKGYDFPVRIDPGKRGCRRKFQLEWLENYHWLVYSKNCDGGFCLPCVLFSPSSLIGQLCSRPLTYYKKATELLKKHAQQQTHLNSLVKLSAFRSTVEEGNPDVVQQLQDAHSRKAKENEEKLRAILECIIFCGKQNIALRGHRNEDCIPGGEELTHNPGNFLALLHFRACSGDNSVTREFHTRDWGQGRRVTYLSPTVQNDLIACCGQYISDTILREIRRAPFFSVLADEATDSSNKEQMPVVVRFVEDFTVREEFLGFVECNTGLKGAALAEKITGTVGSWNLDMRKCRGQGYDGAGNMAGRLNGCAALVQRQYPKAVYSHCNSHALNLCVMSTSEISLVSNMWSTLKEVSRYFSGSPKRQSKLTETVEGFPQDLIANSAKRKLVDLCRTRWVERHSALLTFEDLYPAVVEALENISQDRRNWNAESCGTASGLVRAITSFSFIASFIITANVMAYIHPLVVGLQQQSNDVCQAFKQVLVVKQVVISARNDIENQHSLWWKQALELATKVHALPEVPRTCGRQCQRDNTPFPTPEVYFRRVVTAPLLDQLLSQFEIRFAPLQQKVGKGMALLPRPFLENPDDAKEAATELAEEFLSDLPSPGSLRLFKAELELWGTALRQLPRAVFPSSLVDAARLAKEKLCPRISRLLVLLATLPVTTCTCERSVSALRRLKTYLRSTMGEERLSGLALLHTHYDMPIDRDEVIKVFLRKFPRRIISPNLLEEEGKSEQEDHEETEESDMDLDH